MNDRYEKIPGIILEWLESKTFEELNSTEQSEVLKYLSREEYEEMSSAAALLHQSSISDPDRRETIMAAYDNKHPIKKRSQGIMIWKAAAVFFLVSSVLCFVYMMHYRQRSELIAANNAGIRDTVYVLQEKMSQIEKLIDTVYLNAPSGSKPAGLKRKASQDIQHAGIRKVSTENELNVMDYNELDRHQPKRNSVKDDSLLKKLGFVTTL